MWGEGFRKANRGSEDQHVAKLDTSSRAVCASESYGRGEYTAVFLWARWTAGNGGTRCARREKSRTESSAAQRSPSQYKLTGLHAASGSLPTFRPVFFGKKAGSPGGRTRPYHGMDAVTFRIVFPRNISSHLLGSLYFQTVRPRAQIHADTGRPEAASQTCS